MKVQHEMRSQQPLSTSLRIIQWHLFISTRAAQTEKVKSVLALTGRTRVRISWQRPTRCQYHVLLPLSALTHVSPWGLWHRNQQSIRKYKFNQFMTSTTCSHVFFTLTCPKQLFSWFCVVATASKPGREAQQGNCATTIWKFGKQGKREVLHRMFRESAVYFKVKR